MRKLTFLLIFLISCTNSNIHYIKGEKHEKRIKKVKKQNKKSRNKSNYSKKESILFKTKN